MDLDREQKINVAVSIGALALMISAMMAVGATYSTNGGGLSTQGGQMLVGTIVAFIVMMAVIGYVLATKVTGAGGNDDETPELA